MLLVLMLALCNMRIRRLFALEDLVADVAEIQCTSVGEATITKEMLFASTDEVRQRLLPVSKLHKLIAVSESMMDDEACARQIRRKFL